VTCFSIGSMINVGSVVNSRSMMTMPRAVLSRMSAQVPAPINRDIAL
jgi:hypothetical protein